MFSLVITIISIALVAVLALATLYYGGAAFEQGSGKAQAARVTNQFEQLKGAAEMFRVDKGRNPDTLEEMVAEGYLKAVPVAGLVMSEALAAQSWQMAVTGDLSQPGGTREGVPVFVLPVTSLEVCRAVNESAYGEKGILSEVRLQLPVQCFGSSLTDLHIVAAANAQQLAAAVAAEPVMAGTPAWPTRISLVGATNAGIPAPTALDWLVAPNAATPSIPEPTLAPVLGLPAVQPVPFDVVEVGSFTISAVRFFNEGTAPLVLGAPSLSGANAAAFSVVSSDCTDEVAPGDQCAIAVEFRPGAVGSMSATLNLTSNAGTSAAVPLLGVGAVPASPVLGLSTASLAFAEQDVGTMTSQSVTVSNEGTAPLTFTAAPAIEGSSAFSRTTTCGSSLAVGASCTVTVRYTPSVAGQQTASLTLGTNAPGASTVAVSLVGDARRVLSPASLSVDRSSVVFQSLVVGGSQVQDVWFTNNGELPLTFTQLPALQVGGSPAYVATSTCQAQLQGGDSCSATILFSPSTVGPHSGNLSFATDVSLPAVVVLSGTGEAPPVATAAWSGSNSSATSPSTTFALTNVGQSVVRRVFLRNTHTAGQLAASFRLTGDVAHFTLATAPLKAQDSASGTSACASVVAQDKLSTTECLADAKSGSSGYPHIAVDLTFAPTSAGSRSVQLEALTSNGSVLPGALTFTGTAQLSLPAGFVTLNGLIYSLPDVTNRTWAAADAFCTGSTLAGVTGWRLATVLEMESLRPQKDVLGLAGLGWPTTGYGWTSTVSVSGHYGVNFSSSATRTSKEGDTYNNMLDSNLRKVSCVRSAN